MSWRTNRYFKTNTAACSGWYLPCLANYAPVDFPLRIMCSFGTTHIYIYCSRFLGKRPSASLLPQKQQSMRRNSRLLVKANINLTRKGFTLSWFVLLAFAAPGW